MAVSTTHDDDESASIAAQLVWVRSITTETDTWRRWLRHENLNSPDLFQTIVETSVFSKLLASCSEEKSWADISVEKFLHDSETMSKWGEMEDLLKLQEMNHLLLNVSTEVLQRANESAMVIDD